MGIFSRLATVIKSNINELISKSEDPKKMLEQIIMDMNEQIIKVRQEVAGAIADEKKLQKQMEKEKRASEDWQKKAVLAVEKNNDELAREALKRHEEAKGLAQQYETQWANQKAMVDKLKSNLKLLNDKVQEAARKKDLLIARQKRAEAQDKINKTMSSLNDPGAFDTFSRMEKKVDEIESRADAEAELSQELSGASLEDKFDALEESSSVDDKLAQLKKQLGKSDTPELPGS